MVAMAARILDLGSEGRLIVGEIRPPMSDGKRYVLEIHRREADDRYDVFFVTLTSEELLDLRIAIEQLEGSRP
jgi:hypothetical protein